MADGTGALAPVEAVDAVAAALAADDSLSEQSFERLVVIMRRFAEFVGSGHGAAELQEVSRDFVDRFVDAPTSRGGRPSESTQHFRRCAVRLVFRTARELGLADADPTLDLRLRPRRPDGPRPLTDFEVERCRRHSLANLESTRLAAAWALAEAGVRTGELAAVTSADLDLDAGVVAAPGCRSAQARTAELTEWGVKRLHRHIEDAGLEGNDSLVYSGDGSAKSRQAASCIAISTTLVRAGLGDDLLVRPASVTAWVGRRLFEETGRIEEVASRLGMRSLDRTARLIGLHLIDGGAG